MKSLNFFKFAILILFVCTSNSVNAQIAFSLNSDRIDEGSDIAVDNQGNIFVIGTFRGTIDFDLTSEIFEIQHDGQNHKDIFVASYTPIGELRFAFPIKTLTFSIDEEALGLTLDNNGNIYVTGWFNGIVDFDPSSETSELIAGNAQLGDGFLASYTNDGGFRFAFNLEINSFPYLREQLSIQSDADGNCYLSGLFYGTVDFDPSSNVFEMVANISDVEVFLASYDSQGNFRYVIKPFSISAVTPSVHLAVDESGSSYLSSRFSSPISIDFDPSIDTFLLTGGVNSNDIFVASYSNNGEFINAFKLDCETSPVFTFESGIIISVDHEKNINISGTIKGVTDFDPGTETFLLDAEFSDEFFLASYTDNGSLRYAFILGNEENQFDTTEIVLPYSITSDNEGNMYLVGVFTGSIDFDPSNNLLELDASQNGSNPDKTDIFTVSYDSQGNLRFATKMGLNDVSVHSIGRIAVNSSLQSCITGSIRGEIEYDLGNQTYDIIWDGSPNAFVTCYSSDGTLVGIEEFATNLEENMFIYPNPTSQIINIKVDENSELFDVELINVNGQVVLRKTVNKSLSIDVSNYPQGYYILSLSNGNRNISKPIIISK